MVYLPGLATCRPLATLVARHIRAAHAPPPRRPRCSRRALPLCQQVGIPLVYHLSAGWIDAQRANALLGGWLLACASGLRQHRCTVEQAPARGQPISAAPRTNVLGFVTQTWIIPAEARSMGAAVAPAKDMHRWWRDSWQGCASPREGRCGPRAAAKAAVGSNCTRRRDRRGDL